MLCVTEDWFVLSHFQPIIRALVATFHDVVVVTTVLQRRAEIEALGARVIPFDFQRASFDPVRQAGIVRGLMRLIRDERPDVIHAIALKPIALAGLAFVAMNGRSGTTKLVMHLTGVGFAGTAAAGRGFSLYDMTLRFIRRLMQRADTALLVENPDDAARVVGPAWAKRADVTILGGAGVDPVLIPAAPLPDAAPAVAGYLGRMVWTKGVDVLVEAHALLATRGIPLALRLGGSPDVANPRSIPQDQLDQWGRTPGITCLGRVDDPAAFWRQTSFAVVPSRGGEGLPRALLEAAATSRTLIVTDVPGCRYFVRDGIEGLIVPPNDATALCEALAKLLADPTLTARMGAAARGRLLDGFTEQHVAEAAISAYQRLLEN
jgi:glycosyltransferase involved in cell wall biosynthesis